MKRIVMLLVSLVFAFSVNTLALAKDTLALMISTLDNPFFVSMKKGAQSAADKLGYELVVLDSQNNPAKELANMEDLIVRHPKLILLNPTDSDAVGSSVKLANKANIPVITLDRAANSGQVAAHIASDNVAGGKMAADFIEQMLSEGSNDKVIQLEGIAGTSAARERGKGFAEQAAKYHFDILASQPADFDRTKGLNVMQNLLTAHPDVQAVFAQNDEMALGAVRALQAAGRKNVMVVGFDGTKDGINAVENGAMAATIAQQPAQIGIVGVETADKVLQGLKVNPHIGVPLKLIKH